MLKRHWALWIALAMLVITIAWLYSAGVIRTGEKLTYALDDPYIHMAMAKNLATHGVWGITRHEFSFTSSSPLWTALLSLVFKACGVSEIAPFVLNLLFAAAVVVTAYLLLLRKALPQYYCFVVLAAIIYFTSLVSLAFVGTEHILHALATIVFIAIAANVLARDREAVSRRSIAALACMAAVLPLIRYEGLLPVLVVCALLAARKRWAQAVLIGVASLIPVLVLGLISLDMGSYLLPNTILLKRGSVRPLSMLTAIFGSSYAMKALILGAVTLFVVRMRSGYKFWTAGQVALSILTVTILGHVALARVGWFYRYESYLFAAAAVVMAEPLFTYIKWLAKSSRGALKPSVVAAVAVTGILLAPIAYRGWEAARWVPRAGAGIYQQQYQMGLFVKDYCGGQVVAVNDAGAISFLGDVRCFDLLGFGSIDVCRARLRGRYTAGEMEKLAEKRRVDVAIVYDLMFNKLPAGWIRVGQWKTPPAPGCAYGTVSFYAAGVPGAQSLMRKLRQFSPNLPKPVRQSGPYTVGSIR